MSAPVYVVLLHSPMVNRHGEPVTTSVTNIDIHDIARSARTYGARGFFIVTPILDQHQLVDRIIGHWRRQEAQSHHPDRVEALRLVEVARDFDEVKSRIAERHGQLPEVILTDASEKPGCVPYLELRQELEREDRDRPATIVFGTGWGVAQTFYPEVHRILAPVYGRRKPNEELDRDQTSEGDLPGYNHLSVRAAAATVLDRLFGQ